MTMNDFLSLIPALGAGLLLGSVFFGGLWWTVRKGLLSKRPALWFLGSLLLRIGFVLVGFYVVSGGHWDRLLACFLGFIAVRFVVTRLTAAPLGHHDSPAKETGHAP